ncbi:MAG TPA: hypothetical protein DCR65_11670 [Gammaproteobacteria bacterium]|nr:hypothetical protein [Gammaproteobacteria bacterium]
MKTIALALPDEARGGIIAGLMQTFQSRVVFGWTLFCGELRLPHGSAQGESSMRRPDHGRFSTSRGRAQ